MSSLGKDTGNGEKSKPTTEFHVAQVRAGDASAFAQLYERLAPSLEAWSQLRVTGTLRNFIEPGDVVQEVWWRAMDAFERYDPKRSSFRAWIFKIATNILLEMNRKRRRKARLEPQQLLQRTASLPPELARQATSIGKRMELGESVKLLVDLVAKMDHEDRLVFVHCGLEGLTAADAAMLVGASADTVNKRWQRLRERLSAHPIWQEFDPSE